MTTRISDTFRKRSIESFAFHTLLGGRLPWHIYIYILYMQTPSESQSPLIYYNWSWNWNLLLRFVNRQFQGALYMLWMVSCTFWLHKHTFCTNLGSFEGLKWKVFKLRSWNGSNIFTSFSNFQKIYYIYIYTENLILQSNTRHTN